MPRPRDHHLAAQPRSRILAAILIGFGLVLTIGTFGIALTVSDPDVFAVLLVVMVVFLVGVGTVIVWPWWLVRLTDDGYLVRFIRGAGAKSARWVEVQGMDTAEVGGARCVVLRLRNGETTTIPVDLLDGDSEEFVRNVGRFLSRANRR